MAQTNPTPTANVLPFERRNPDPEIERRHAKDIPPVFHKASQSERMELLRWIAEIDNELMKQHLAEFHQGATPTRLGGD